MISNNKISYVEFPAKDLKATKRFFAQAFHWSFVDYGSAYTVFSDQGINGGFYQSNKASTATEGAALVILYSDALEETLERVLDAGGSILKPIFSFPGGRRFHFTEPSGNQLAVWSDVGL